MKTLKKSLMNDKWDLQEALVAAACHLDRKKLDERATVKEGRGELREKNMICLARCPLNGRSASSWLNCLVGQRIDVE